MADDHQKCQLFLLISFCFVLSSYAYQFKIGGRQGWIANPYENYNTWAGRMRFQVNDTLLFKYSRGDSVLVVNKDDYDKCYSDKPIMKFDDGNTIFKFDRSGPFYFIGGNKDNCEKGQKMIIVVLAVRNRSPLPTPAPPVPALPPSQSPTASPPKGPSPVSPSPSGGSPTPTLSPAPTGSPTSPSPANASPAPSPKGLTPAPAITPASSSPSPSPVSSPPSPLSPSGNPGSPGVSPPPGGGGSGAPTSGNTPSDIRSPTGSPAGSSATSAFTPTAAFFSAVSFVMSGLVIFI